MRSHERTADSTLSTRKQVEVPSPALAREEGIEGRGKTGSNRSMRGLLSTRRSCSTSRTIGGCSFGAQPRDDRGRQERGALDLRFAGSAYARAGRLSLEGFVDPSSARHAGFPWVLQVPKLPRGRIVAPSTRKLWPRSPSASDSHPLCARSQRARAQAIQGFLPAGRMPDTGVVLGRAEGGLARSVIGEQPARYPKEVEGFAAPGNGGACRGMAVAQTVQRLADVRSARGVESSASPIAGRCAAAECARRLTRWVGCPMGGRPPLAPRPAPRSERLFFAPLRAKKTHTCGVAAEPIRLAPVRKALAATAQLAAGSAIERPLERSGARLPAFTRLRVPALRLFGYR